MVFAFDAASCRKSMPRKPASHLGQMTPRFLMASIWRIPAMAAQRLRRGTKTLPKVAAEMALSVLAYNLTRAVNAVGIKPLTAAIAA
jgi:hypothetical protein